MTKKFPASFLFDENNKLIGYMAPDGKEQYGQFIPLNSPAGSNNPLSSASEPALQLLAGRTGFNGEKGVASAFLNTHSKHYFPYGASRIALVYSGSNQLGSTPSETACPANAVTAITAVLGGVMVNFVKDETITFDLNSSAGTVNKGVEALVIKVLSVSAGVPVAYEILNGGAYLVPLAAASAQVSTSGIGTGATVTCTWKSLAAAGHVGFEPVWNNQVFTGKDSVKAAYKGLLANGLRDHTLKVPVGDLLVTEFLDVDIKPGTYGGIRGLWMGSALPLGRNPIVTSYGAATDVEEAYTNATFYDESLANTISPGASSTHYQPVGIIGIPKITGPSVILWGNSRDAQSASGTGSVSSNDALDNDGNSCWGEKAMSAINSGLGWPFSNLSRGSQRLGLLIPASNPALTGRANLLKTIATLRPTAVGLGDSVNDFSNGDSYATVKAREEQLIQEIKAMGVPIVFTWTTDPQTSGAWTNVDGSDQSLSISSANSILRNQALATGQYAPYDFFIDFRSVTEMGTGTGKWKATGVANAVTGDGTHASPAINAQKAAFAKIVMAANINR